MVSKLGTKLLLTVQSIGKFRGYEVGNVIQLYMGFGGLGCEISSNCKRFTGSFNGRVWVKQFNTKDNCSLIGNITMVGSGCATKVATKIGENSPLLGITLILKL